MYTLLSRLTGLSLDLFYRRRHLGGAVPREGACLLVANHPNALIDPVAVTRVAGRRVRLLAKAPLFSTPVVKWLVKGMGALPVYRAKDGADTSQNEETFRAVFDALASGECIALFPEGISHHEPALQPLKTGAARMALGACAREGFALDVKIVPVGLVYEDKQLFRSELVTEVGAPLSALSYREAYEADPRAAAHALTADIDEALREVTLNLERWEDRALLELAERAFPGAGEDRVKRVQALANGARALRERDPARHEALRAKVERFRRRLEELGLSPDHVDARYSPTAVLAFLARNLVALLVGLPVALLGALAYLVPYGVARFVPKLFRTEPDLLSSIRVLISLVVFPAWHAALASSLTYAFGWRLALPLGVVLPFAGLYAARFLDKRMKAARDAWTFVRTLLSGRMRAELTEEREALAREIDDVAGLLR